MNRFIDNGSFYFTPIDFGLNECGSTLYLNITNNVSSVVIISIHVLFGTLFILNMCSFGALVYF